MKPKIAIKTLKTTALIALALGLIFCYSRLSLSKTVVKFNKIKSGIFEAEVFKIDTNAHWLIKLSEKKGPKLAPNYKTRNCVQFMHDLLNPYFTFTQAEKDAIYIKGVSLKQVEADLKNNDSTKITGICKVLIDKGLADWVPANDSLKPGDIVQYWFQFYGQPLVGHTGIIGEANHREFHLLSSGYSINGYGYKYGTEEWCLALYAVRLKE